MIDVARSSLSATRVAFLRQAGTRSRLDHAFVTYPEASTLAPRTRLAPDGDDTQPEVPWPPAHAFQQPKKWLSENVGVRSLTKGTWRAGFAGDAAALFSFVHLSRVAGYAFHSLLASRPEYRLRFLFLDWPGLNDAGLVWTLAIHWLGWHPVPGSSLRGTRLRWNRYGRLPYPYPRIQQGIDESSPAKPPVVHPYYSVAGPDLFLSSALAVDSVLWLADQPPPSTTPSDAPAPPPALSQTVEAKPAKSKRGRRHWVAQFRANVFEHRDDWTIEQHAKALGVDRHTISRAAERDSQIQALLQVVKGGLDSRPLPPMYRPGERPGDDDD